MPTSLSGPTRKDRGSPDTSLHTNFKLGGDGETISLGSALDCPVDVVTYPALDDDQVYRRNAEGRFSVEGSTALAKEKDEADEQQTTAGVTIVGSCVAINEVMAKNDSTIEDSDGEFGDWIELANLSDDTIDLSGYEISDEEDRWVLPDGVEIEAGGFLLLWADEGDSGAAGEELHTSFKLSGGGEPVTLVNVDGEIVAALSSYPELEDDESFGVNDAGDYVVFDAGDATPGQGPTHTGCDFEVGSATGAAEATAEGDSEQDDASTEESAVDSNDDSAGGQDLARTGVETSVQSLLAQLLLLSGATLVTMARIAQRRSRW